MKEKSFLFSSICYFMKFRLLLWLNFSDSTMQTYLQFLIFYYFDYSKIFSMISWFELLKCQLIHDTACLLLTWAFCINTTNTKTLWASLNYFKLAIACSGGDVWTCINSFSFQVDEFLLSNSELKWFFVLRWPVTYTKCANVLLPPNCKPSRWIVLLIVFRFR